MKRLALILALIPSFAFADGVMLDAKVTDKTVVIRAKTSTKSVVWVDKDEGLVDVLGPDELPKVRVVTGKPGKYRVVAVGVMGDKPVMGEVVFTIGDVIPVPPTPVPPTPPANDFAKKLADAYAADASPWKRSAVKELAAIYRVMAKHARDDKDIVTSKQLIDVLNEVKKDRIPDSNILRTMRMLIADKIMSVVGAPADAPFDRERVSAVFEQIVAALPNVE